MKIEECKREEVKKCKERKADLDSVRKKTEVKKELEMLNITKQRNLLQEIWPNKREQNSV